MEVRTAEMLRAPNFQVAYNYSFVLYWDGADSYLSGSLQIMF